MVHSAPDHSQRGISDFPSPYNAVVGGVVPVYLVHQCKVESADYECLLALVFVPLEWRAWRRDSLNVLVFCILHSVNFDRSVGVAGRLRLPSAMDVGSIVEIGKKTNKGRMSAI